MQLRLRVLSLILMLFSSGWSALAVAADNPPPNDPLLFPATGHTLAYNFRAFWEKHGGLPILGYPLTEVFLEDGRPVQYFERTRLEWHGEYGLVLGGRLGSWVSNQEQKNSAFAAVTQPGQSDQDYFVETKHTLGGGFQKFWHQYGGLETFGFPLSEEFSEVNPQDGQTYTVQYFERARFEWHPQAPPAYQVELGQLGRQYLAQLTTVPAQALAKVNDATLAWNGLLPTHINIARLKIDSDITEDGFSLQGWDVPRYKTAHYWPVGSFPGMPGNIVLAAHSGYKNFLFDQLPQAQVGDIVTVMVGQTAHRYRVYRILTVLPDAGWVMSATRDETLTLITCVPIGVYDHRLIVLAAPVL